MKIKVNKVDAPTHCANPKCDKPLVHIEGRRKKKYCGQVCNSSHWQATHYVPSDKKPKFKTIPIEQWNEIEKKLGQSDASTFPKEEVPKRVINIPKFKKIIAETTTEKRKEVSDMMDNLQNEGKITQYETELSNLGEGKFAAARKKWLTNKIKELKQ